MKPKSPAASEGWTSFHRVLLPVSMSRREIRAGLSSLRTVKRERPSALHWKRLSWGSRVAPGTDSLVGLPNDYRLPGTQTIDLLLRKVITFGSARGGIYLDVRNLLNRRNTVAVRRDDGMPEALPATIQQMADAAYNAHPEPIPYESSRYRAWADLNHDGYLAGHNELFPLYLAAARDYTQPLFAFGPPRLIRMGLEFEF